MIENKWWGFLIINVTLIMGSLPQWTHFVSFCIVSVQMDLQIERCKALPKKKKRYFELNEKNMNKYTRTFITKWYDIFNISLILICATKSNMPSIWSFWNGYRKKLCLLSWKVAVHLHYNNTLTSRVYVYKKLSNLTLLREMVMNKGKNVCVWHW